MEIHDNKGIRVHAAPDCYLCGTQGTPLYQGLRDQLFGTPGKWDMKQCLNPECGLTWLETETLLYQFLTQQYEQAKVQEAKHLHRASARPGRSAGAKKQAVRMLIVLVSTLGALTLQGFYILTREMNLNVKSI